MRGRAPGVGQATFSIEGPDRRGGGGGGAPPPPPLGGREDHLGDRCDQLTGGTGDAEAPLRRWSSVVAAFFATQLYIIWFAANGPFVDEGVYTVAGLRVLEGKGGSDGYWPGSTAVRSCGRCWRRSGISLGGLAGARMVAVLLSLVTLVAFAKTAEAVVGESAAAWGTGALAVNGLFMALAHFAVYDVPG